MKLDTADGAAVTALEEKGRRAPGVADFGRTCPVETAFGCPRNFLGTRYVYTVISPRARGLSVGVNLNPDRKCNYECVYCEVDRGQPPSSPYIDLDIMTEELHRTLQYVCGGGLAAHPRYAALAPDLLRLRHVTLSGDGEPTLSAQFLDVVETVAHVRVTARIPFFKIVLITNASHLCDASVQAGLKLFTSRDEIWAKLDAGTQGHFERVNRPNVSLETVSNNILAVARQRPVVIQTLFPMLEHEPPSACEVDAYAQRLNELKQNGAKISLVQIYSATRPHAHPACGHLPLRQLSRIAHNVRALTGLRVEVY